MYITKNEAMSVARVSAFTFNNMMSNEKSKALHGENTVQWITKEEAKSRHIEWRQDHHNNKYMYDQESVVKYFTLE